MKIGSDSHRDLFCRHFVATFTSYEPATLPWPELSGQDLLRLRKVPFWQEVLYTERRAGAIVTAFAATVQDPVIRNAIELQGFEETRHAELLREMIHRYGIDVVEHPLAPLPSDSETAFKDFGFGECLDSFLGFGAFKLARESHFLPESLFKIFETLMFEETRHIVFFVNWMAWSSVRHGRGWLRHLSSLRFYGRALRRLAGTVRRANDLGEGKEFSATEINSFLEEFTFRTFLEDCYRENRRRMSEFDVELLRPTFLPRLADVALSSLRLWHWGGAQTR
jgi:hypothetical protein